ncbi:MAG: STAS domain-containing protein, partial [Thermoanaerobaculia bacterium]
RGVKKILLNMQKVRTMDSSGLGELVRSKVTATAHGATIKLLHVEDKVEEVLEMTRLIGVFDTFDDEIDAIASFRE